MAVVIRLRRTGRKNLPCFRITVTDSRFPRDGRSLETLGLYDPLRKDLAQQLKLDQERTQKWLAAGAVPSEIVQSLFKRMGVFPKKPLVRRKRPGRKKVIAARTNRKNAKKLDNTVYVVPEAIDKEVAKLKLKSMGTTIDTLTAAQVKYMATWSEGT